MNKTLFIVSLFICLPYSDACSQELKGEDIYAKISDAVVIIYTFDAKGKALSQGSGVVLNDKGWVVTNYHVFAGAEKLVVKHKEKVVEYSNIVGLDVEKDILILKIKDNSFQSIKIGNSDSLKVGQKVYAIGSPLGFENTMTEGIISGLRHFKKETKDFIQISAAISPGSSGGAVVNAKGQLIAISTSTLTEAQNLNFAIPVNDILAVYKQEEIKQNELDAAFYFSKGVDEFKKQNYDAAIKNCEKAIALNHKFAEAYNTLGIVYSKKEDFKTAIIYYRKAIDINLEYAEAYYNLGVVYGETGDFKTAILYYRKAIDITPEYADAYINLGVAYSKTGDFETAILYLKQATIINPNDPIADYSLGVVYDKKGDFETAITCYKEAISSNKEYASAYNNLGVAYAKKGDFEVSIPYLKQAIILNPKLSGAYYVLGLIYDKKGDKNMSQYYFEKAYELDPSLRK